MVRRAPPLRGASMIEEKSALLAVLACVAHCGLWWPFVLLILVRPARSGSERTTSSGRHGKANQPDDREEPRMACPVRPVRR
jgi:hypothetical protein